MALTLLDGWSEADLLKARRKAQEDYLAGAAAIGSGAGDVTVNLMIQRNAMERIEAIQEALYELNSTTYARYALVGVNETLPSFA